MTRHPDLTRPEWLDEAPPEYDGPDVEQPEERPCPHVTVSEQAGYPERSGRCQVYAVCEDCGEVLGQVGWDSVL